MILMSVSKKIDVIVKIQNFLVLELDSTLTIV